MIIVSPFDFLNGNPFDFLNGSESEDSFKAGEIFTLNIFLFSNDISLDYIIPERARVEDDFKIGSIFNFDTFDFLNGNFLKYDFGSYKDQPSISYLVADVDFLAEIDIAIQFIPGK